MAELCQLLLSNKISAASKGFLLERCHHNVEVLRLRNAMQSASWASTAISGLKNPANAQVQPAFATVGPSLPQQSCSVLRQVSNEIQAGGSILKEATTQGIGVNSALFLPKQIVRFNGQIMDRLFNGRGGVTNGATGFTTQAI